MSKLVVVLDDYGLSKSVNDGIRYVLSHTAVEKLEISLMVYGRAVEDATDNLPDSVPIGIHIDPLGWKTLGRPSTTDDYIDLFRSRSTEFVQEMIKEELSRFYKIVGKYPSHITSHKGIHANFKVLEYVLDYAREYDIPFRRANVALGVDLFDNSYASNILIRRSRLKMPDRLIACISGNSKADVTRCLLEQLEDAHGNVISVEVLFHPGFVDRELIQMSSLNYQRGRDLSILIDSDFWATVMDMGFEYSFYNEI